MGRKRTRMPQVRSLAVFDGDVCPKASWRQDVKPLSREVPLFLGLRRRLQSARLDLDDPPEVCGVASRGSVRVGGKVSAVWVVRRDTGVIKATALTDPRAAYRLEWLSEPSQTASPTDSSSQPSNPSPIPIHNLLIVLVTGRSCARSALCTSLCLCFARALAPALRLLSSDGAPEGRGQREWDVGGKVRTGWVARRYRGLSLRSG